MTINNIYNTSQSSILAAVAPLAFPFLVRLAPVPARRAAGAGLVQGRDRLFGGYGGPLATARFIRGLDAFPRIRFPLVPFIFFR